jgi:hypothetical protein
MEACGYLMNSGRGRASNALVSPAGAARQGWQILHAMIQWRYGWILPFEFPLLKSILMVQAIPTRSNP